MTHCKWEGCKRPVRAVGYCASHYTMWRRKHPTRGTPRRRGPKAKRLRNVRVSASTLRLVGILRAGPLSLGGLAEAYGTTRRAVEMALRKLEASGLNVVRTANPENGREVLRYVEAAEAERYTQALEVKT